MRFQLYSTGLFATWVFHPACNTLFDCGEGAALTLGKRVFGIDRVCLSHGHTDHIAGLPTLINIRNRSVGDPFRPLAIFYPEGDRYIAAMQEFIRKTQGNRLRYPLTWEPIEAGTTLPIEKNGKQAIETFPTKHNARMRSMGFRLVEHRKRLREEYRGRSDIGELLRDTPPDEKARYEERYVARLWTYTGDMVTCDLEDIRGTDVLLTDATFLSPEDRAEEQERQTHATLAEAAALAAKAGVEELYAIHLSGRYARGRIAEEVEKLRARHPGVRIIAVYPGRTYTAK